MASAKEIKNLRQRTGVGILDCKKALDETSNIEEAIQWLKEKGIAKGAAKAEREALEGVIIINQQDNNLIIAEINCETDFVARNDSFRKTSKRLAQMLQEKKLTIPDDKITELLNQETFRIGEKIAIGQVKHIKLDSKKVIIGQYVHNDYKKGAIVLIEKPIAKETADCIAMHIVAMNPLFISKNHVTEDFIKKEKKALLEQLKKEGKPEQIITKIIEGKMRKIYSEIVLEEQDYALAEKKGEKIKDLTKGNKIIDMYRLEVGVKK